MGCSPPDWYYEQAHRANIEKNRREHEARVKELLRTVDGMGAEDRAKLKRMLDGEPVPHPGGGVTLNPTPVRADATTGPIVIEDIAD